MISLGLAGVRPMVIDTRRRVRVMVVDDSLSVRNLVTRVLREEPWIEVAGTACDGADALRRIPELRPDVITLDVEMPNLNGIQTVERIHKNWPYMITIMLSSLTESGAAATIDALMRGASDYICKTAPAGSTEPPSVRLKRELLARIRQFCQAPAAAPALIPNAPPPVKPAAPIAPLTHPALSGLRKRVVAIGVSTGGPTALGVVIPGLPANLRVPVLVVQHMPAMFTSILAQRLKTISATPVCEATAGMPVEAGHVYIAPGGYHMIVRRAGGKEYIALDESPPEHSCRPAVDPLFRSVNQVYGKDAVAVVLTGMGSDGLKGAELLKKSGAAILAQNEASSVVWGMPGMVAKAGIADAILDLAAIAPEILKRV